MLVGAGAVAVVGVEQEAAGKVGCRQGEWVHAEGPESVDIERMLAEAGVETLEGGAAGSVAEAEAEMTGCQLQQQMLVLRYRQGP